MPPHFSGFWKHLTKPTLSVSKHSFMDKTITGKDLKPCETGTFGEMAGMNGLQEAHWCVSRSISLRMPSIAKRIQSSLGKI